jgi:hypothetical protein
MAETVCTFSLDNDDKKRIEAVADKEHRSLSGQIRIILEEWLEKNANTK